MSHESADFSVAPARRDQLGQILGVQRRAFGRVAAGLDIDPELLPPIKETLDEVEALFDQGVRFFVATSEQGRVVGSVRGVVIADAVEVGRLVVDDGWQRRGVASALMDALESTFSDAARFELFTGAEATVPLALYAKRGYRETRREDLGHVELVWLEKRVLGG